jgi:hypothetical protein
MQGQSLMRVLTTAIDLDRHGHAYGGKPEPDQPADSTVICKDDRVIAAATVWLQQAPGCTQTREPANSWTATILQSYR